MLEKLFELILHVKGSMLVGVLLVGSTGALITGTLGPDGAVSLRVFAPLSAPSASPSQSARPSPDNGCVAALAARADAIARIDADLARARADLREIRDLAATLARSGARDLSDQALDALEVEIRGLLEERATAARTAIRDAADLSPCQPSDPNRGAVFDMADLRQRYRVIVERVAQDLRDILQQAGQRFEALVKNAKPKIAPVREASQSTSSD